MAPWNVEVTAEELERVRSDERFAALLSLGRSANLLRSALSLVTPSEGTVKTVADRLTMSGSLLVSGLVAEALVSLERYGRHWKTLPAYQEFVVPLIADPTRKALTEQWLRPLRNKTAFHNDETVSIDGLKLIAPRVPHILAHGTTGEFMDVYYPVSDSIALMHLIHNANAVDKPVDFIKTSIDSLTAYAWRICKAIDAIIMQGFSHLGFTFSSSD